MNAFLYRERHTSWGDRFDCDQFESQVVLEVAIVHVDAVVL